MQQFGRFSIEIHTSEKGAIEINGRDIFQDFIGTLSFPCRKNSQERKQIFEGINNGTWTIFHCYHSGLLKNIIRRITYFSSEQKPDMLNGTFQHRILRSCLYF